MKRFWIALAALSLGACAHLPGQTSQAAQARTDLWHEAHMALYQENFARAETIFSQLAERHPDATEGREALFYVGGIYLDPRNRAWNSERAETTLQRYLQLDTVGSLIHRRPEATILLELARQLNLPPAQRVAGLQTETAAPAATPQTEPRRVVAPEAQLRALQEENESLRQQLVQRDDQIRRQREELERIRRALAPRPAP